MSQSTPGVAPPESVETTVMVVWPGIGAFAPGRLVGRMAGNSQGRGFFTLGKILAAAAIPIALGVYAWRLMPHVARRYRLTNRRIVIQRGLLPADGPSVALDAFDNVLIDVRPGQAWLRGGDLVFRQGDAEVFRLAGVPNPRAVRQVCLDARSALLSVRKILEQQTAAVA